VNLCTRALDILGDTRGDEADAIREKLTSLQRKYERFSTIFELVPIGDGRSISRRSSMGFPRTCSGRSRHGQARARLGPRATTKAAPARADRTVRPR